MSGNLREAQRLGEEALAIMRAIEQLWGSARMLLGLGDLARLRAEDATARDYYLEALNILREVNARPEIARCLAGLGAIAMSQSDLPAARQHLAESLQLSFAAGSRIGIARGLEAFARLVVLEHDPALAVQLAGAISALRADAHLPTLPGARTQRFLDAAAGLGEHAVTRLWQVGTGMTPAAAVRLALESDAGSGADAASSADRPAVRPEMSASGRTTGALTTGALATGALTPREHEVVALLASGLSNRDIARKLFISPATAARHVANILAKLGFSSRSQVAAWANGAYGESRAAGTD
jgi:DNA-binding CsgD family transcriptional regulator